MHLDVFLKKLPLLTDTLYIHLFTDCLGVCKQLQNYSQTFPALGNQSCTVQMNSKKPTSDPHFSYEERKPFQIYVCNWQSYESYGKTKAGKLSSIEEWAYKNTCNPWNISVVFRPSWNKSHNKWQNERTLLPYNFIYVVLFFLLCELYTY